MRKLLILFLLIPLFISAQNDGEKILLKAVSYHDPKDSWSNFNSTLYFKETRPTGPDRSTFVIVNNKVGKVIINRNDEEEYEIVGDVATVLKGDRDVERGITLRNYYLYLWGLPMKLLDKSTPEITLSGDEKVGDEICKVLRVAYEKDIWYFFIDDYSGRLLQYKFYQNIEETKGELITLEDEILVQGMKIPQKRNWYTLPDMEYLGTDILERSK